MALSSGQEGTTTNRILNQFQYALANIAWIVNGQVFSATVPAFSDT